MGDQSVTPTKDFAERELRADELSADAPGKHSPCVRVINPAGPLDLSASFKRHGDHLLEQLDQRGALLFRDFDIPSAEAAEALVLALGIRMDTDYLGGASPRSNLTRYLFSSTEAPSPYIISFHTEMCYLRHRPAKIIFFCATAPSTVGETPIFDCAAILEALDPALRDRIEDEGLIYERYFKKNPSSINVYKTWRDAFHTDDKGEVEAGCRHQGLDFEWTADDDLIARAHMPGIMVHPRTGRRCLSLTLYNEFAASCDIERFAHRYNSLVRLGISRFSRFMFKQRKIFMRTLWGNGDAITLAETRAIIDAAWQSSTLFRWHRGDLLILDNILAGHGRLNVVKPRSIAAGLGDTYDVRAMVPQSA